MQEKQEVKKTSTYESPKMLCVRLSSDVVRTSEFGTLSWNGTDWGESFEQSRDNTFIGEGN